MSAKSNGEVALDFVSRGWPVLPIHWDRDGVCSCGKPDCEHPAKHPVTPLAPHGSLSATTNVEIINQWWKSNPDANVGIATGRMAGFFCVDVDARTGGYESLDGLVFENGQLPDTKMVATGSGGQHYYYKYPEFQKIQNGTDVLGDGIDIRGDSGYILAPPSRNMNGPYTWVDEETPIIDAPKWLLDKIREKTKHENLEVPGFIVAHNRNTTFAQMAGVYRRTGMGYDEIFAALEVTRTTRTEQPPGDEFTEKELAKIVRNVCNYKPGNPIITNSLSQKAPTGLVIRTLADLSLNPPPARKFVWQDLLTAGGTSNLVAKPKVGKSTFARALIRRIASYEEDTELFGRKMDHGSVLYITVEEQEYEVIQHFRQMGMSEAAMRRVLVHCGRPPEPAHMAIKHLEEAMQMTADLTGTLPILVVIDTLQLYARIKDINSYSVVTEGMTPYQHLARESLCHFMFLHHANRGDGEAGDNVMGSTAFFAGVDTLLDYRSKKGIRTLLSVNRYGKPLEEVSVTLDPETMDLVAAGTYDQHLVNLATQAILGIMGDAVLTEAQIFERLPNYTREHLYKALMAMCAASLLHQGGQGKRNDPHTYTVPMAIPLSAFPSWEQTELPDDGVPF